MVDFDFLCDLFGPIFLTQIQAWHIIVGLRKLGFYKTLQTKLAVLFKVVFFF